MFICDRKIAVTRVEHTMTNVLMLTREGLSKISTRAVGIITCLIAFATFPIYNIPGLSGNEYMQTV